MDPQRESPELWVSSPPLKPPKIPGRGSIEGEVMVAEKQARKIIRGSTHNFAVVPSYGKPFTTASCVSGIWRFQITNQTKPNIQIEVIKHNREN